MNSAVAAVILLPHAGQEIEGGSADIPVLKGIERMNLAVGLSGVASPTRYRTVSNSAPRPPGGSPAGSGAAVKSARQPPQERDRR